MTERNIHVMEIIVDELANGETIASALKAVYEKRSVAFAFDAKQFDMPIEELHISTRTRNALRRSHIDTVNDAIEFATTKGIMNLRTFGKSCGIELFEGILNYCWMNMNQTERTEFLLDVVERNEENIHAELM